MCVCVFVCVKMEKDVRKHELSIAKVAPEQGNVFVALQLYICGNVRSQTR